MLPVIEKQIRNYAKIDGRWERIWTLTDATLRQLRIRIRGFYPNEPRVM